MTSSATHDLNSGECCHLKCIIIGGSIAGLCAAYTLRGSAHEVIVLDKRDDCVDTHGGVRVPPNMSRLLETLPGGKELLREHGESSKVIGRMVFIDEVLEDLGCKFWMIAYDVLIQYLLGLCRNAGVQLKFQTEVTAVHAAHGQRPAVVTILGDRLDCDLLVGADGRDGIVMGAINQQSEQDEDDYDSDGDSISEKQSSAGVSEIVSHSYSISLSAMRDDPALVSLAQTNEFMIWPGANILVTGHKSGHDLYILTCTRVTGILPDDVDTDWDPNARPTVAADVALTGLEPRVERLFKIAHHFHSTIQRVPIVRRIVHPTGLVVIGDAAHTITINATHNSSMAVEDGFALGRVFSHVSSPHQIPYLLQGYRQVRFARSMATEASELGHSLSSPSLLGQRAR
ncbi:unnamed protein product [Mycena citricolor]|uniref:FAD-binding domain-containing protein n=1 Tax=Mycena citricolor TaxID=2018698 RepID=A0AAD2GVX3_9AGAR|nr:unnamed protein product [Mycena citricolor]